ncbi:MAG: methyltransferase domain-containing protein [Anaerolineales bacterium]
MPFDHFDFLAPHYDRIIRFQRLEKMLNLLGLPTPGRLLDAGGGTGRVAEHLRPHVDEIVVADISTGMLAQSRAKSLDAACVASERLPFAESTFDRVLMVDALHHVIHQGQTMSELYRVLKPGGRLVIEEPDVRTFAVKLIAIAEKLALMRSHFLTPPQIAALLPPDAQVTIETEDYNAWVIAIKPS